MKTKILYVLQCEKGSENAFIFSRNQINNIESFNNKFDIQTFFFSANSFKKIYYQIKNFREQLKLFNPDIVHIHYGSLKSLIISLLCIRCKKIITFHGSDINNTPSDGFIKNFTSIVCSQVSNLLSWKTICVSKKIKAKLLKKNHCHIIPMCPDTSFFVPKEKNACRKLLKLNESTFYVLFNSNNPKIKRLDIAEKAIANLRGLSIQLLCLKGNIPYEKMPLYVNASDMILLCSDNEGSPSIIKEAMACNKPVISNDVGDVKELINRVKNCFIVEKNPTSISEKINFLKHNYSQSNGRQILTAKGLTQELASKSVCEIYSKIKSL